MSSTLIAKLAAASIKVGALATDKVNSQQNYSYISADKILDRAGEALAQQGIVIIPGIASESTVRYEGTDKYGKPQARYDALVSFNMLITDGDNTIEYPWVGRGNDYAVPDKALYKAITSGHKYFLMKLLNIGVGNEDGEHEESPPAAQPAAKQSAPAPVQDNPFDGASLAPQEIDLIDSWDTPADAYAWAIEAGACANEFEAKNSMKKVVEAQFAGKLTKANMRAALSAFYSRQQEKLLHGAEAA